jgi:hypothetical protein
LIHDQVEMMFFLTTLMLDLVHLQYHVHWASW